MCFWILSYLCNVKKWIPIVTRIFRSAFVLFFLLVFLAGNTGISFFVHTCGSSHEKDVFIYREIFHQHMSCCCEDNFSGKAPASPGTSFTDADCCRISYNFIKLAVPGLPILEKIVLPLAGSIPVPSFALFRSDPVIESKASFIPFLDHSPPPLSGMNLVCFLHQIRIPAPVC
jgi:hypothetical protein